METQNLHPIKLKLKDDDAWQDATNASMNSATDIDEICEILGSITPLDNVKTEISINTVDSTTYLCHNGEPFDQDDINRLLSVGNGKSVESNKKGTSTRGFGVRAIMSKVSEYNIEDMNVNTLHNYSYIVSRINSTVIIEHEENNHTYQKDDIILYIIDNNYNIIILNKQEHTELVQLAEKKYKKYVPGYGVMFNIPKKYYDKKSKDAITKSLRFFFNRCDYLIKIDKTIITENKPGMILDEKYGRYLKCNLDVYKCGNQYYGKLESLTQIDIMDNFITYIKFVSGNNNKLTHHEWEAAPKMSSIIEDFSKKKQKKEYSSIIIVQSSNNNNNKKEFTDYYGDILTHPGIVPYYGNNSLCNAVPPYKQQNNNVKIYLKGFIPADRPVTRNATDTKFKYVDGQSYNAAVIEDRQNPHTLINATVLKSQSDIKCKGDTRGDNQDQPSVDSIKNPLYLTQIPYLITFLFREYIWNKTAIKLKPAIKTTNTTELEFTVTMLEERVKVAENEKAEVEKAAAVAKAASDKAAVDAKTAMDKAAADAKTATDKAATDAKTVTDKAAADAKTVTDKAAADAKTVTDKAATDANAATAAADDRADMLQGENRELHGENNELQGENRELQKNMEDTNFSQSVRLKICKKQSLIVKCILCDYDFCIADFRYCHIKSIHNNGMGTENNGLYACRHCNSGTHPMTFEVGMGKDNMIPWLKKKYPNHADNVIKKLTEMGKDIDND
jgi:hypothetical protein